MTKPVKARMQKNAAVVIDASIRIRCVSSFAELELTREDGTPLAPCDLKWTHPGGKRRGDPRKP